MIKKLALAVGLWAAGTLLVLAAPAQAVVVNIDPGTVGETFRDRSFAFSELDGQAFDGSAVTLDFVFAPKQLHILEFEIYSLFISFELPGIVSSSPPPSGGVLLDENGNSVASNDGASVSLPTISPFKIEYGLRFRSASPLSFQTAQFSFLLPTFGGGQVSNARLDIRGLTSNATLTVGAPAQQLPEPASLALFGLGLLGLGVAARRRQRR